MSRLCLDTSAYSYLMRGDPPAVAQVDRADWIGVPSVVLGELWVGFLAGKRRGENEADLHEFLAHPRVEELVVDHDVARLYAEIFIELKRAGTPLPTNDIWVAASAARSGATVLTYDAHFAAVRRVGSHILETGGGG